MLLRNVNKLLRYSCARMILNCRNFASANNETDPTQRDPAPFFFDKEVQTWLRTLTTIDYKKVLRTRKDGHKMVAPEYKFMTDEELQQATKAAQQRAQVYLQMPPVVKPRSDELALLCQDPGLQDYSTTKYVFTDITYGLRDRDRFVVVREPNGTLRHATWEERDRIVPIYFPSPRKELQKPKMFENEHLQSLLDRKEYEFILDRACTQFDPDDPNYQATVREVYERVNLEKHFDILRSTRHFGPMVFHLVWMNNIDNLLCELIETRRIKDAVLLVRLYHKIHPTSDSAVNQCSDSADDVQFLLHYVRLDSGSGTKIEKLLHSYKELQRQEQILEEGIKRAHGIPSETSEM